MYNTISNAIILNLDRSPHNQVARANITITVHQLPELYIKKISSLSNQLTTYPAGVGGGGGGAAS